MMVVERCSAKLLEHYALLVAEDHFTELSAVHMHWLEQLDQDGDHSG
jgi:hypothetical protein